MEQVKKWKKSGTILNSVICCFYHGLPGGAPWSMYHRMCIAFLITCITFLIKHVYNIPDPVYNIPDPVYNIPDRMGPLNCFLRRGFVGNLYDYGQALSEES